MQTQLPSNWDKDELVGQLADLCEALLAEGFRWEDVQNAVQVSTCASALALIMTRMSATDVQYCILQAIPLEQMSEASVLDWLCLNVDPAHLPKR